MNDNQVTIILAGMFVAFCIIAALTVSAVYQANHGDRIVKSEVARIILREHMYAK